MTPGGHPDRPEATEGAQGDHWGEELRLAPETGIFGPQYPLIRLVETELIGHVAEDTVMLAGPADVPREIARLIGMRDREYCAVVHLNARHQAVSVEVVSVGTTNSSLVHPREVFKAAILANATAIICAHNHPSGDVEPSQDDLALQRRLVMAGEVLGIPLLDFLIVSGPKVWSSRQSGCLPATNDWVEGLKAPGVREDPHDRARQMTERALGELALALEQGRSEALTAYLATMSRFHRYSFGNVLLIAQQRPDATMVAGFRRWLELDRHVLKGEKGIAIMAPMLRRALEEDGTKPGESDGPTRLLRGFRVVYVFDVKQTEGAELPAFASVAGDPGEHLGRLKAFATERGIDVQYAPDLDGAHGLSAGGKIKILEGQTPAAEFLVLAHEIAHELLHHDPAGERPTSRKVRELEAEAVAYVVTSACGLETSTAASDYIQLYDGDRETLMQSLGRIQKTAATILADLLPEE